MTANSSSFNGFISILGLVSLFVSSIYAEPSALSEKHSQWVAEQVFANECSSNISCLTSWNSGEEFPSLGIGHFIWYQRGQSGVFTESFPELLDFYQQSGIALPEWLEALPQADSPWLSREQFYNEFEGPRLTELRRFLQETMATQAAFIIQRQQNALPKLLANTPRSERQALEQLYHSIATAEPPYGLYALIDYVNFKGEGISPTERYQGQGWGLLQVLRRMLDDDGQGSLMQRFARAAATVLENRIANSPPERGEQRWLPGWLKRVASYVPPPA